MTTVTFNDFPGKVLISLFKNFEQTDRQKLRRVCTSWKKIIDEEYPVEIRITPTNYENLFQCPVAVTVGIHNLTFEYTGNVAFGSSVRCMEFTGKVLSSNMFYILRYCPGLEVLRFSSLKQVLGIEGSESVTLPNTTMLDIKVRPDQETFTSDEIIVISALRQIIFSSLESIQISTATQRESWDVEMDYDEQSENYDSETLTFTAGGITPMSLADDLSSTSQFKPSRILSEIEETEPGLGSIQITDNTPLVVLGQGLVNSQLADASTEVIDTSSNGPAVSQTIGTQTMLPQNLHVIVNHASVFANESVSARENVSMSSEAATSTSNASSELSRRARYNLSDFEARLFYANLELLMEHNRDSGSGILHVLNDSRSHTGASGTTMYFMDIPEVPTTSPAVKHTVFFELLRNNHAKLKNLYVRTRAEFMCFGNLNSYFKDIPKVQFEELEYSFGRTQLCFEHILLREQCHLKKIRVHILDDMWRHLMFAVNKCQTTLTDLDVKVMSVNDERMDITSITQCANLKNLKLLHFFEKESLCQLPRSLNKLILNGPVSYKDMEVWTRVLHNLEDLTLLLNVRGDKIDLSLYKKFLKMPQTSKLTFIQCPMELMEIMKYIDSTLAPMKGFKFWINGPKEINELPSVQYVYTLINQDFSREQIQI